MKHTVNLGLTFLCTSFSLSQSKFFTKCFLNLSRLCCICYCFCFMIFGSWRSSIFIQVMEVNISMYFLSWRLIRQERVNKALLYYWLMRDMYFYRSRIYLFIAIVFWYQAIINYYCYCSCRLKLMTASLESRFIDPSI